MRADALRNRARILEAARTLFVEEGLSASVQQVARRARVSTGTVSRHFRTKEDLFEALLRRGIDHLVVQSQQRRQRRSPGEAFFETCQAIIEAGAADRGLAERLRDATSPAQRKELSFSVQALCDELELCLHGAQAAGKVRPDVSLIDVETLMDACMVRLESSATMADVIQRGLSTGL